MRLVFESMIPDEGASAVGFGAALAVDKCRSSCSISKSICAATAGGKGGEEVSFLRTSEFVGFKAGAISPRVGVGAAGK